MLRYTPVAHPFLEMMGGAARVEGLAQETLVAMLHEAPRAMPSAATAPTGLPRRPPCRPSNRVRSILHNSHVNSISDILRTPAQIILRRSEVMRIIPVCALVVTVLFRGPTLASAQQKIGGASAQALAVPIYPDKPAGLKKLTQDILRAKREADQQALTAYLNSLILPDAEAWFNEVFGSGEGAAFAKAYARLRQGLASQFSTTFDSAVRDKLTDIEVRRFERACDPQASEFQYPVLAARQREVPFYEVRLTHGNFGQVLWFFVYASDAFRYIGEYRLSANPFAGIAERDSVSGGAPANASKRIRVGGTFQQGRLIHREPPNYPENARRAHLQGTVRLKALISREGAVKDLQVLEGHCWLAQSAIKAVEKWRYSPFMLNGEPVEVVTTIDVVFTLGR